MKRALGVAAGWAMWFLTVQVAGAIEPWQSPVGPDGVTRIIVEAEDMAGVDQKDFGGTTPEWRVGRTGIDTYQCNTFGGHWQSRTRTAMTDAGDNRADITARIVVPKAGTFKLWVKYECPPFFNYAFDLALTPADAKAPVFKKTYGLIDSPKHFCFTDKLTTGSLYWSWGIDHDAAEGYLVELQPGAYMLTLSKTKNPEPAGMRSIDAIMLTDDLSELSSPRFPRYPLLDELRRANHVFMRVHVGAEAPGPVKVTWNRWGKRYNDFYSAFYMEMVRYYDAQGAVLKGTNGAPLSRADGQLPAPLNPGEASVWMDIGPTLNVESAGTFVCRAVVVDTNGAPLTTQPASIIYGVDIALVPSEKQILKRIDTNASEPGGQLTFLLQPDLKSADGLRWTMKLADVYRMVTKELDEPERTAPMPGQMRFYGGSGAPLFPDNQAWSWEVAMNFRRAQGLNTVFGSALELKLEDYARQQAWCRQRGYELLRSACFHHSQDVDDVAQKLQVLGTVKQFYYLSYGDEIGLPAVDATKPEMVAVFHDYLRQHGVTPDTFAVANWDRIKPLNAFSADVAVQIGVIPAGQQGATIEKTLKRLYWHSARFRVQQGVTDFARKTARFRQLLGPDVNTSANLGGMHPFYWVHQSSFIDAFKYNAMTMAWTEDYDYCMPETSRLVAEFLAGYLKAGAKYNGQRMMFYCMPHYPGQSPQHLLQNCVLEWGQNVKDIDWFCTAPDGFTTENYINPRGGLDTFRTLRQASEMAGVVEHWLEPAQPLDAPVAMLVSEASDMWELGGLGQGAVTTNSEASNVFQEERKNTYYALRNAGYRVDLITEADAQSGYLKRYQALYVGGENMERATARALVAWVKAGGVLYASAGAARKDEYDEPLTDLDAVLGRGERVSYQRYRGALRSKLELLFLKPLETVTLADGSVFDAYATLEKFTPLRDAEVLGKYGDVSPAFVRIKTGQGMGYYVGTLPAETWAKKALPVMPCGKGGPENNIRYPQFEPTDFDAVAAAVIVKPLTDHKITSDVKADTANVVCNRLAGPNGTVITIVNLGQTQKGSAKDVELKVAGLKLPGKVWSYAYPKGLKHELKDGLLAIKLPELGLVDIVIVENP